MTVRRTRWYLVGLCLKSTRQVNSPGIKGGYIKYYTSNGRGLNVCCIEGPKDSLAINDAYPAIEKMFNAPRKAGSKSKYAR